MIHLPASSNCAGTCLAAPDACKTPTPVGTPPIPYPNTAQLPMATNTEMMVCIQNRDTVTQSTEIPRSNGDEPGVAGGVVSGVFGDKVVFRTSSSKVYAKGKKIVYVTCVSAHNGSNANAPAGMQIVPSQVKVFVAP